MRCLMRRDERHGRLRAMSETADVNLLGLTAQIVAAQVENNLVSTDTLPDLIQSVYRSLASAGHPEIEQATLQAPAVSIKRSVSRLHCLSRGRQKTENAQASFESELRSEPCRLPCEMGTAPRLSHGGAELRSDAVGIGQKHRPWSEGCDQGWRARGQQSERA